MNRTLANKVWLVFTFKGGSKVFLYFGLRDTEEEKETSFRLNQGWCDSHWSLRIFRDAMEYLGAISDHWRYQEVLRDKQARKSSKNTPTEWTFEKVTDDGGYLLTKVGARDTCVSKKMIRQESMGIPSGYEGFSLGIRSVDISTKALGNTLLLVAHCQFSFGQSSGKNDRRNSGGTLRQKVLPYWHLTFDIWHTTFELRHLNFDI